MVQLLMKEASFIGAIFVDTAVDDAVFVEATFNDLAFDESAFIDVAFRDVWLSMMPSSTSMMQLLTTYLSILLLLMSFW